MKDPKEALAKIEEVYQAPDIEKLGKLYFEFVNLQWQMSVDAIGIELNNVSGALASDGEAR